MPLCKQNRRESVDLGQRRRDPILSNRVLGQFGSSHFELKCDRTGPSWVGFSPDTT